MKKTDHRQRLARKPYLLLALIVSMVSPVIFQDQGWTQDNTDPRIEIRSGPRKVRPAAAAGSYYPADPTVLYAMVDRLLNEGPTVGCRRVKAVLVPHAGYVYSGGVAAASFREIRSDFRRVFILAANHNGRVDFRGVSMPDVTHYGIPAAEIPLSPIMEDLLKQPLFVSKPAVHTQYMIEAELPFLYYRKGKPEPPDFTIVPMILGRMNTAAINKLAQTLDRYVDEQTLFVFSVDLSHFKDDRTARKLDMQTIQSIMSMDAEALSRATTDGNQVLRTMVALARGRGWEPTRLKYRNSGDVTGDKSRVVGYGSIAFHDPFSLTTDEQQDLLELARSAIKASLAKGVPEDSDAKTLDRHPMFRLPKGVFVTLEERGKLRGCIGELFPSRSLVKAVRSCAIKSATEDHRFQPVTLEELEHLTLSISVLSFPRRIKTDSPSAFPDVLQQGKDGVILVYNGRQSTFLPKVWEDIPKPKDFLSRLCLKQNAPADCWRNKETVLYRYNAYDFSE